jgi:hypothetical protein
MKAIKTYRELDAWRAAMELSEAVYSLTRAFPDIERHEIPAMTVTSCRSNVAGQVHHPSDIGSRAV